jgi:hypothetical protein
LRETYHIRLADAANSSVLAQARLTSKAVVACLKAHDYDLTLPTYSEIEAGANLPRNAAVFLAKIEECLGLKPQERRDLELALAHDILYARMGKRAGDVLPLPQPVNLAPPVHQSAFGTVLRECRLAAGLSLETLSERLLASGLRLSPSELRVLQSFGLRPVTYLSDQLGKLEQATIDEPWPMEIPIGELIELLGCALPPNLLADQRLTHAAALDDLARQVSGQPTAT